ncbi:MAG: helix-turn-helix transcriptional regulator [Bacteroidales bacterium]|nr:helix-turn-helix transcriptional regulator [Bacteroidales bacterium]
MINYLGINATPVLLNVGEAHHDGDWNFRDVSSPFTRIHFIRSGSARMDRGGEVLALKSGCLYLTPPYTRHSYANEGPLDLVYVHIYFQDAGSASLFDLLELPAEVPADRATETVLERLLALHPDRALLDFDPRRYDTGPGLARILAGGASDDLSVAMETEGLLRLLLARFLAGASPREGCRDERVFAAVRHIGAHLGEAIRLDDLASAAAVSKDHFIRLFSRELGITPGQYINRKKIEAAQLRLLLHPGESVKSIAYSLGFDNLPYFNRLFLKLTGESPGRYRESRRAAGRA